MGAALYESRESSIAEGQESRERSPELPLTLSNHLVVGAAMQLTFEGFGSELAIVEAGVSRLPRGQRSQWRRSKRFASVLLEKTAHWSGRPLGGRALEKLPYRWWMFAIDGAHVRVPQEEVLRSVHARACEKKSACRRVRSASTWGIEGLDSAPRSARCNMSPTGPIRRRSYTP